MAANAEALPLSAGMKAAVKDCGSDPSVLCLDMLCIQRNCCVQGSALPSPAHALSREAEGFSAAGVGPGLEEGGERERKGGRKTKQNRFIGSVEAAQTHWGIVSPQRNQLLRVGNHRAPTASQD